jgi:hypothetical protein
MIPRDSYLLSYVQTSHNGRWLVVHDDLADLHYTFNQVYAAEIVTV